MFNAGCIFASVGSGHGYFSVSSSGSLVYHNGVTHNNGIICHNSVIYKGVVYHNGVGPPTHQSILLRPRIQPNDTPGPRPEPVPRLPVRLNAPEGTTSSEMSSTAGEGAAARREAVGGERTTSPAQRATRGKQAAAIGRCEEEGCGASLASWAQYLQHLQQQHNYDFTRCCDSCLKDMPVRKLEKHRRLHLSKSYPFRTECQQCDAKFFSAGACEDHVHGFHEGRAAEQ